jgi:hypothetical protein
MRSLESSTVGLTYFSPEPDDSVNDGTSLNADPSSNIGCEEFGDGGNPEYGPVSDGPESSELSYRKTWMAADELVSVGLKMLPAGFAVRLCIICSRSFGGTPHVHTLLRRA